MYSGTTLTKYSGRLFGAHQKFDRVARRHLSLLLSEKDAAFPTIGEILKFEGKNGPDGIKSKSPAQNEPWHYIDPFDESDKGIFEIILSHHQALAYALRTQNKTKAAFEAAWLAHAVVDGLTPAHHFPYEKELSKLRGGQSNDTRTTLKAKIVMPGNTYREQVANNWKMWGPKGLMLTHGTFEFGVAGLVKPLSLRDAIPSKEDIHNVQHHGVTDFFHRYVKEVATQDLYTEYYRTGWTPQLARKVRRDLAPLITRAVTLTWYSAVLEAAGKQKKKAKKK